MLMHSGLLHREVAQYMFGYYAMKCWESDAFWKGVNRKGTYWTLFASFAERMRSLEDTRRPFKVSELRF